MKNTELVREYAEKIRPLLPLAQKAYGPKNQNTPAHVASREYTNLLIEFTENGGSMIHLASELGVAYSGMRRRVFTAGLPSMRNVNSRKKLDQQTIDEAIMRVREARARGTEAYHAQLAHEYNATGVSLSQIAKGLGIANAGPLYYGVQRHAIRLAELGKK